MWKNIIAESIKRGEKISFRKFVLLFPAELIKNVLILLGFCMALIIYLAISEDWRIQEGDVGISIGEALLPILRISIVIGLGVTVIPAVYIIETAWKRKGSLPENKE